MSTFRMATRLRRRLDGKDDTGSLMLAMLLITAGTLLAAVMLPMFLTQLTSTQANNRWVHELDAAEGGVDVMLGHIRAANDGAGNGDISELPCGTMTGTVGVGGTSRYQASVAYYSADPEGQNAAWLSSHSIVCVSGGGTLSAPAFAIVTSKGTETSTGSFSTVPTRTLQATYIFQTNNQNIPGGAIHVYKTSTSTDLCLDAGSTTPTAGTAVLMNPCSAGSAQQKFAYNSNLTIALISSETAAMPLGMCLDAGTPEAANAVLKFQPCGTVTKIQQQWSFNDSANMSGTNDGQTLNNLCWNVQNTNVSGSQIILSTNCNGSYDNTQTFSPEAAVGAGNAGTSSGQLINFNQFGRCLDVTNQDVNAGFMIAWPCKQAPNPTNISWNQRYILPTISSGQTSGTGRITTNPSAGLYCLQSPLSTAAGQYVIPVPCPSTGTPTNLTWTVTSDTGVYATSYLVKDGNGNCLSPTDPTATPADLFSSGNNISKIVVQPCNGSTLQKWNAPADILQPTPLKDITEK